MTAAGSAEAPTSGTKRDLVLGLLGRGEGASLGELIAATGWLPHTSRAALSRLRSARTWLEDLIAARVESTGAIALRENCSERSVRMTLSLASLSPTIVRAIIEGRLPRGIGIKHLADLPASWSEQQNALGF